MRIGPVGLTIGHALLVLILLLGGCARLPYLTTVIYEGPLTTVVLQREVDPVRYSHPVSLTAEQVAAILQGFSVRAEQRLPLRWYAEEQPPQRLLRDDEIARLASYLVEGLQQVGPDERVSFILSVPGMNRADSKTVTSGWLAVKEPFLYIGIEQYRAEIPLRGSDGYVPNHPQVPPMPGAFLLFFEPGRFWGSDQAGIRGLRYRDFLKYASVEPATR